MNQFHDIVSFLYPLETENLFLWRVQGYGNGILAWNGLNYPEHSSQYSLQKTDRFQRFMGVLWSMIETRQLTIQFIIK